MSNVARSIYRSGALQRLPKPLRAAAAMGYDRIQLARDSCADLRRHVRFGARPDSAFSPGISGTRLATQLIKDYHRVEKGLALATPRQPFGLEVRQRLVAMIPAAAASEDSAIVEAAGYAGEAVQALDDWNRQGNVDNLVAPLLKASQPFDRDSMARFFQSRHLSLIHI